MGEGRGGDPPEPPKAIGRLRKRRQGKCVWCELYFSDGDFLENDPRRLQALGGTDAKDNTQRIHRHGHDQKTAQDGSCKVGPHDNAPRARGAV